MAAYSTGSPVFIHVIVYYELPVENYSFQFGASTTVHALMFVTSEWMLRTGLTKGQPYNRRYQQVRMWVGNASYSVAAPCSLYLPYIYLKIEHLKASGEQGVSLTW